MAKSVLKNANGDRYVSARTLSDHLDLGATFIRKLESEGVLQRTPKGFHIDQARVAYIRHLRRERRQPSPQHEATADLAAARAEWLRLRSAERMKELVPVEIFDRTIDELAGATFVAMSSIPARLFPYAQNIPERRRCEAVIFQVRRDLAAKALRRAEEVEAAEAQGQGGAQPAISRR